ncbi:MAG: Uncharacterized protein G01um101470_190 [Parcubacteria group bacterium Gr01-1014_70]|nr:MAG: Uncharacterized protein G01um101470_190 [Parcubacteria group bacterium Gr01-1014_70]
MSTLRTIEEEITELQNIRNVLEIYESVSATYMRRTRGSIIKSRAFYESLRGTYDEVTHAYRYELAEIKNKTSIWQSIFWKKLINRVRRRTEAAVWLSANTGLYGDIIQKTFQAFLEHLSSTKCDVIIVGKRGKLLFEERMPHTRYIYQDLPDTVSRMEDLSPLLTLFSRYQRIRVFYGKFESFVSQFPISTMIGESEQPVSMSTKEEYAPHTAVRYLFEPSLEEISRFFETEIRVSLFQQITEESRLAKLAARMYQLDAATEGIGNKLTGIIFERHRLQHQLENKKQLEIVQSRMAMNI